jgi:hypothetical protein
VTDSLVRAWNRFWFAPSAPTHLAFARFAFFGLIAAQALLLRSQRWAAMPEILWQPVSFFAVLGIPAFAAPVLGALDLALAGAATLAAIGLFTRASMVATAFLGLYLLGLPSNFGKVNHDWNLAAVILCFMAFSRAGTAWSVDALLRSRRAGTSAPPPERSGEYTWPIQAGLLCCVAVYFAAGIAKLTTSGIAWALSDNLATVLVRVHYSTVPPSDLGLALARQPWLTQAVAAAALSLELLAPLMLVHRYARYVIGLGLFAMQAGIWLTMGIAFKTTLAVFPIFLFPWGAWIEIARERFLTQDRASSRDVKRWRITG